jgi:hypothetical protein
MDMPTKRKELSDLQRELLQSAVRARQGKIWLPKGAADSFPTTYSALVSLQRRKLLQPERASDPAVVSWKITKAGKEAAAPPKAPARATSSVVRTAGPGDRASIVPASGGGGTRTVAAAKPAPAAKPTRSMRDKPAAPPKGARGRGRT